MKHFALILLAQSLFGLACVVASYPEASAGIVFTSLMLCVAVNNNTSSISLLFLAFFILVSLLFEKIQDSFIFIQVLQILLSCGIFLLHK